MKNICKLQFKQFSRTRFQNLPMNFFSEKITRKDYYQVLGIPKNATEEQLKKAYRNLAKVYHPDVSTGKVKDYEPSIEKFRDIAEAYAVLSNKTLRLDYDTRMNNYPEMIYNKEKIKTMDENLPKRDATGNIIQPVPMKCSYAEYRLEKLKELRKKFNVDDHGFYKGGVPRKNLGNFKGDSLGVHGQTHDAWDFNNEENRHDMISIKPHADFKDVFDHQLYMNGIQI